MGGSSHKRSRRPEVADPVRADLPEAGDGDGGMGPRAAGGSGQRRWRVTRKGARERGRQHVHDPTLGTLHRMDLALTAHPYADPASGALPHEDPALATLEGGLRGGSGAEDKVTWGGNDAAPRGSG